MIYCIGYDNDIHYVYYNYLNHYIINFRRIPLRSFMLNYCWSELLHISLYYILYNCVYSSNDREAGEECRIVFVDEIFSIEKKVSPDDVIDEDGETRIKKPDCDHCKVW